ncbi:unnamed protein product, partial [marine sediment metagenome]
ERVYQIVCSHRNGRLALYILAESSLNFCYNKKK